MAIREAQRVAKVSRLRRRLHSFTSKAKHVEELVKSEEDHRSSLHYQLTDQEWLTNYVKRRVEKLENTGAGIISKAYRKGFLQDLNDVS